MEMLKKYKKNKGCGKILLISEGHPLEMGNAKEWVNVPIYW